MEPKAPVQNTQTPEPTEPEISDKKLFDDLMDTPEYKMMRNAFLTTKDKRAQGDEVWITSAQQLLQHGGANHYFAESTLRKALEYIRTHKKLSKE